MHKGADQIGSNDRKKWKRRPLGRRMRSYSEPGPDRSDHDIDLSRLVGCDLETNVLYADFWLLPGLLHDVELPLLRADRMAADKVRRPLISVKQMWSRSGRHLWPIIRFSVAAEEGPPPCKCDLCRGQGRAGTRCCHDFAPNLRPVRDCGDPDTLVLHSREGSCLNPRHTHRQYALTQAKPAGMSHPTTGSDRRLAADGAASFSAASLCSP